MSASSDKCNIRIGKISSIDYPKGTARITFEDKSDSTTAFFSFLAWQYWMPKISDQVLVAHFANGTCAATIIGPVWHNDHRPPEGYEGLYRKDYNRKYWEAYERFDINVPAYFEFVNGIYDIKTTKDLCINVNDTTKIKLRADGGIEIDAPQGIHINGPVLRMTGDVVAGPNHVHLVTHANSCPHCGATGVPIGGPVDMGPSADGAPVVTTPPPTPKEGG